MEEQVNQETGEVTTTLAGAIATKTSEKVDALYGALVTAQKGAKAVGKDAKNKFHGYKYASSEALIEEARGALTEAGLAVYTAGWWSDHRPLAEIEAREKGPIGRVHVRYRLVHSSGQWAEFESSSYVVLEKGRPADKAEAGAITLNLGYMLRGLLLLPREDESASVETRDDRGNGGGNGGGNAQAAAAEPDKGAEQLADQYIEQFKALEVKFAENPTVAVVVELERLPQKILALKWPSTTLTRCTDAYNPIVTRMRDKVVELLVTQFKALDQSFDAAPSLAMLQAIERLPEPIVPLKWPEPVMKRLTDVYNPIVTKMREKLTAMGVDPKPNKAAA